MWITTSPSEQRKNMRLWSIHPQYLDSKGLVALWREGLLAQNVLLGKTKGYKNHPQLIRFKNTESSTSAIGKYLTIVADEADRRGYNFNRDKIKSASFQDQILVTDGQIEYEFNHLLKKLEHRDQDLFNAFKDTKSIDLHPLFKMVNGEIETWEII